jgi:hypothetical protein
MGTSQAVKSGRILGGFRSDGRPFYVPVTLKPDEIICPECEGTGRIYCTNDRDGFEYRSTIICDHCDGDGALTIEPLEDEQ